MTIRSPLSAVAQGVVAGALSSLALKLCFSLRRGSGHGGGPPERGLRRPDGVDLARRSAPNGLVSAGRTVRIGPGAAWGAAYGVAAASSERLFSLPGGFAFGLAVWGLGNRLGVPLLLQHTPQGGRAAPHLAAAAAHGLYGAAVYGAFAGLDRARRPVLAALAAEWLLRKLPRPVSVQLRPFTRRSIELALHAQDVTRALADWK